MASEWSMYADPVGLDEGETFVTTRGMNASFDCIPVTITPTPLAEVRARCMDAFIDWTDRARSVGAVPNDGPLKDALEARDALDALQREEARAARLDAATGEGG